MEDMLLRFVMQEGYNDLTVGWKKKMKVDPGFSTMNMLEELLRKMS
ncbi:hypothetical protein [Virgibacillus halodenitrificans]|nr:hypothetical protein [Virgibacillus halodenitrificans]CDQ37691.1 hypothetical protein BN993_07253 [Virgibacillus halodenitrificans]